MVGQNWLRGYRNSGGGNALHFNCHMRYRVIDVCQNSSGYFTVWKFYSENIILFFFTDQRISIQEPTLWLTSAAAYLSWRLKVHSKGQILIILIVINWIVRFQGETMGNILIVLPTSELGLRMVRINSAVRSKNKNNIYIFFATKISASFNQYMYICH